MFASCWPGGPLVRATKAIQTRRAGQVDVWARPLPFRGVARGVQLPRRLPRPTPEGAHRAVPRRPRTQSAPAQPHRADAATAASRGQPPPHTRAGARPDTLENLGTAAARVRTGGLALPPLRRVNAASRHRLATRSLGRPPGPHTLRCPGSSPTPRRRRRSLNPSGASGGTRALAGQHGRLATELRPLCSHLDLLASVRVAPVGAQSSACTTTRTHRSSRIGLGTALGLPILRSAYACGGSPPGRAAACSRSRGSAPTFRTPTRSRRRHRSPLDCEAAPPTAEPQPLRRPRCPRQHPADDRAYTRHAGVRAAVRDDVFYRICRMDRRGIQVKNIYIAVGSEPGIHDRPAHEPPSAEQDVRRRIP